MRRNRENSSQGMIIRLIQENTSTRVESYLGGGDLTLALGGDILLPKKKYISMCSQEKEESSGREPGMGNG